MGGLTALVAVKEGQVRKVAPVEAVRGLVIGKVSMDGGDRVGPPVGGVGCECAGLPGESGQRGVGCVGCRAAWGVVVVQGEGGVGQDVEESVDVEDWALRWGGLVGEVLGASRWSPGQGSAQP